jgi:1,4-alpha-glucan branching enzyme
MDRRATAKALLLIVVLLPLDGCRAPDPETRPEQAPTAHLLELEADPARVDRVQAVGELPGAPLELRRSGLPGRWTREVDGLIRGQLYRYRFRVHRKDLGRWISVSDPTAWLLDASRERWSLLRAGASPPRRPPPPARSIPLQEMIIYEICPRELVHPKTPFAHPSRHPDARGPGQVLKKITERIRTGYFNQLGVNTLELMPLVASAWTTHQRRVPERDPWGYAPISWYALNGDYGAPEDLAELVRAAHERGLSVIVDYSLDHGYGGDRHGLLTDLWPAWRKPEPDNPWGLLELKLGDPRLRRFLIGALERFLVHYNVDGFRMDWTEKMPWREWVTFVKAVRRIKPKALLISENPVRDLVARAGFDGTWDFFFQWEAPLLLRQVYTNYDGINRVQVDTQTKLVENLTTWKRGPHAPPSPLVRYIESHDLPRIARPRVRWQHGGDQLQDVDGDGRTPDWLAHGGPAKSRLGATLLATVPGAPLIFAGQEFAAADDLVWAYDPLDWRSFDRRTFAHYRKVFHLRQRHAQLRSEDLRVLVNDSKRHLLVYSRGTDAARPDEDSIVVALNFSSSALPEVAIPLPAPGRWQDLLGGRVFGPGQRAVLSLPRSGSAILVKDVIR